MKTCPYCGYKWEPRVKNPKSCPRCTRRQDIERKRRITPVEPSNINKE